HARVTRDTAVGRDERWSMDFVTDRLENGSSFRILTVVDQYTRECLALKAGHSLKGGDVAKCLSGLLEERQAPRSITVDNGSEFYSQEMDSWAYRHGIELDFIRPGKPVENAYIESFNGRLGDECLNTHLFDDLMDAQAKLACWQKDYNEERPHGNLGSLTPAEFAENKKPPNPAGKT
ncbi:MAG: transposase, partial [Verrucomicrobiaceae bacterium]